MDLKLGDIGSLPPLIIGLVVQLGPFIMLCRDSSLGGPDAVNKGLSEALCKWRDLRVRREVPWAGEDLHDYTRVLDEVSLVPAARRVPFVAGETPAMREWADELVAGPAPKVSS